METPSLTDLKVLYDVLNDKVFALGKTLEELAQLKDWQARGCQAAFTDVLGRIDVMLEIVCRE